jgi:ATP-dependent Clp protease ATP-binding subunit ClpB
MTSNIGSEHILDVSGDDSKYDLMRNKVMEGLRGHFRPEFLNRVDDIILFHTLNRSEMRHIIRIQLRRVENLLKEQKISLEISQDACNHLVEAGYDPIYGARPLKRSIQREVENPLATKLLENTFISGDTILIDMGEAGLTFKKKPHNKVRVHFLTQRRRGAEIRLCFISYLYLCVFCVFVVHLIHFLFGGTFPFRFFFKAYCLGCITI